MKDLMKYVLITAVFAAVVFVLTNDSSTDTVVDAEITAEQEAGKEVEILSVGGSAGAGIAQTTLELNGQIEAAADVDVLPEASGVVRGVYVSEGDTVSVGQTLLELENSSQRIAVGQQQAALETQQLALDELLRNAAGGAGTALGELTEQQQLSIDTAYKNLLNNDLRAYPLEPDEVESYSGPIISGSLNNLIEGEYRIEVYRSGGRSGYSYRLTGLESDTESVVFNQATPLGNSGLFLQWPETADGRIPDETWVISIPNTRSASYEQVLSAYENAQAGRDLNLVQAEVTPEQIERQQQVVRQQQLAVQSAQLALSKTIVRSPIAGTITSLDLDPGDFAGSAPVASVKSLDDLEIVTYVNEIDRLFISEGSEVTLGTDLKGVVTFVGSAVDAGTQRVKVTMQIAPESQAVFDTLYTEGQTIPVSIPRSENASLGTIEIFQQFKVVPLLALQVIGTDTYVFAYNEETSTVAATPVTTGNLLGEAILITSGLDGVAFIAADARGLSDGQSVQISVQ